MRMQSAIPLSLLGHCYFFCIKSHILKYAYIPSAFVNILFLKVFSEQMLFIKINTIYNVIIRTYYGGSKSIKLTRQFEVFQTEVTSSHSGTVCILAPGPTVRLC